MSEPIYRQLDKGQYAARGDDRHWVEGGRHYRITELVQRMDGGANFQAVEDDVGRFDEAVEPAWQPPPPEDTVVVEPEWKPPEFPPLPDHRPSLKDWAKDNGLWVGRGAISNAAKAAYAKEFDV